MLNVSKHIEAEWVRNIRDGDGKAFEQLFRSYCQPLIQFVGRYVRDIQTAENLVQDLFLSVWGNRAQLDPTLSVKSYLYTAAKNRALKHLRHGDVVRRSTEDETPRFPGPKTPEDELQGKEISTAIHRAVEALPEKTRICFSMNRFDHLTYTEIAEIQGVSVKTVETQMGHALRFLRERLAHLL